MPRDRDAFGRNSSELIRLVLAVAVLYRHSFDLLASGHTDVVLDLIPPRTHLGRIAHCFFMVGERLPGDAQLAGERRLARLPAAGVRRIYPAFVVASVFSAFVAAPLGSANPAACLDSIDLGRCLADVVQLNKLSVPPSFPNPSSCAG